LLRAAVRDESNAIRLFKKLKGGLVWNPEASVNFIYIRQQHRSAKRRACQNNNNGTGKTFFTVP